MAKISALTFLVVVICNVVVEGRSLDLQKRDLQKDKAVREMMSLVNIRKQLNSMKESHVKQIVITEGPASKLDEEIDAQDGGSVSHAQLCSDAVSFLKVGSEIMDKRDLVINYVYNYCIKPSSLTSYDIVQYLNALMAQSTDDSVINDWPNWPGFGSITTPRPSLGTTVDYWQQLYDKLFQNEQTSTQSSTQSSTLTSTQTSTQMPSTTTDWWDAFLDELFNEDDEYQTTPVTTTVTTTVTSPASSTDYFDVAAALGDFFNMIEQENEENDVTTSKASTSDVTNDDTLQALLNLLTNQEQEADEEDNDVTTQRASTTLVSSSSSTTESLDILGAFSDFWNSVENGNENNDNDVSNELPPVDMTKKMQMKKRLLNLLAESLLEKRQQQAMRK